MGDRANYAVRENGQVRLYYSHWGAVTVAEDVFWGPLQTEEFIRNNKVTTDWLDDVWAEGRIALNKDDRHLTYFYFEWPLDEDIRKVYESILTETWAAQGWKVQRAQQWSDVAHSVGVDRALVTSEPSGPGIIALDELGKNLTAGFCCAVVSIRADGQWVDRAIDFLLPGVLMNGAELIERLDTIADLDHLRSAFSKGRRDDGAKTPGDWIEEYCAIDVASRSMRVTLPAHEEQVVPVP